MVRDGTGRFVKQPWIVFKDPRSGGFYAVRAATEHACRMAYRWARGRNYSGGRHHAKPPAIARRVEYV